MRRRRQLGALAVVVLTLVSLVAGPLPGPAGAEEGHTGGMTVSPSTGLVDRQVVVVDVSAVRTEVLRLWECKTGAVVRTDCDAFDVGGNVDQSATRLPLRLDARFRNDVGPIIDCRRRPGACSVVAVGDDVVYGGDPITGSPSVPLDFTAGAPLVANPTVAVQPNRGLRDGQTVSLHGSGFVPASSSSTRMCTSRARTTADCGREVEGTAQIDDQGNLTSSVVVDPTFSTGDGRIVDCRARRRRCVLTVGNVSDPGDAGRVRLQFDPTGPLLPRPKIGLEPSRNLLDDQPIGLTGTGFTSNPFLGVDIVECPAHYVDRTTCRYMAGPLPGADGSLAATIVPDATITDGTRTFDCRTRVGRCVLVAGTYDAEFDEIATLDLAFDPHAPLRPPPVLRADPAIGARYGQAVTVSASGFRPLSDKVDVSMCAAPGGPTARCLLWARSPLDASGRTGRLSIPFPATFVPNDQGPPVNCTGAPGACVIRAVTEDATRETATVPIRFAHQPPPARYLDPVFDKVDVTRDLVYGHAANYLGVDQQLHLDIYQPAEDTAHLRPLMIWLHGGYFSRGDKTYMASIAAGMAMRGYVSASIDYRLRPVGPDVGDAIRDAYADAETAVAWLRQHASAYGIDPNRIAIGGYSAGAFSALNVGYAADRPNGEPANVGAVVSIAGGLSIGQPERGEPPALFFHGRDDDVVAYGIGQSGCARIQAAGPGCSLITYEGIQHGYVESDVLNHTADFLDQALHLPGRKPRAVIGSTRMPG